MTTPATERRQWTERDIKAAVWRHFTAQGYAVLDEVSTLDTDTAHGKFRRIDLLAVRGAKKLGIGPHEVLAIEVKVSRGDFLNDVRHPEKQAPWRDLAHRHAYVVPAGLVSPEEVPDGHGLLVVDEGRAGWDKVSWAKQVRFENKKITLPARIVTAWAYDLARYQSIERGLNPLLANESVGELSAKVSRLEKDLENARAAELRAQQVARQWRTYAKALTGAPCGTCGEELRAGKQDRHGLWGFSWKHADKAHDEPCKAARYEAERQRVMAVAIRDHETHPQMYPPVNPVTFQVGYWADSGPAPTFNPDEEPPTHG